MRVTHAVEQAQELLTAPPADDVVIEQGPEIVKQGKQELFGIDESGSINPLGLAQ